MMTFSHVDNQGKARMVDVSEKTPTVRRAIATAMVKVGTDIARQIQENTVKKGDVLAVARIAGIMAGKDTHKLIPLCHPLPLDQVNVGFAVGDSVVTVTAEAKTTAKTGVEMEALTAASVAALTIYDMCKGLDKAIEIACIRLAEKHGGKSGSYVYKGENR